MQNIFDKTNDYDVFAGSVIPRYDEIQSLVIEALKPHATTPATVIDIGCGTGKTLAALLAAYPQVDVVGIDSAASMLDVAQQRLRAYAPERWQLILHDIVGAPLQPSLHAAISIAALNNIEGHHIEGIFAALYASLIPGGTFIYADFIAHESSVVHTKLEAQYDAFVAANAHSRQFVDSWSEHSATGYYPLTLSTHIAALEKVGFHKVALPWLYNNFAIITATK